MGRSRCSPSCSSGQARCWPTIRRSGSGCGRWHPPSSIARPSWRPSPRAMPHRRGAGRACALSRSDRHAARAVDWDGHEQWRVKLRLPGERHPNGRSYVVVDLAAGRVTEVQDARLGGLPALYDDWLYGWHIARLWGLPQAWAWCLASLATAALAIAGVAAFTRRARPG
ncbi:MAG: hypothetical protein R3E65_09135 [Steroidobacteraceae bacterium]